jgi:hypothetical protein
MISEKQLEANRRNAQLSTGPKTEAGKARCSLNATRHALTGQVTVMTEEDREAFRAFSARMTKALAPEGELEIQLAQRLTKDSWRLNRLAAIEDNLFALGHSTNSNAVDADHPQAHAALLAAHTFTQQSHQLQLLSLYEQRLNRAYQQNLAAFQALQAERKAKQAKDLAEAGLLLQLSAINDLTQEPAQSAQAEGPLCANQRIDGFVFSNAEIVVSIDRANRRKEAQTACPARAA